MGRTRRARTAFAPIVDLATHAAAHRRCPDPGWSADVTRERDALLVQIGDELEAERETQGLTVTALARQAGISKRATIHVRKAAHDCRVSTLVALARALGRRLVITSTPDRQNWRT